MVPAEKLVLSTAPPMPLDAALKLATEQRADLKSAAAELRAAEESFRSARAEHLPALSVSGYLGVQGINPNAGNGVFSGTASLSVPGWQGGKIHADEEQARGVIDQRRAEYENRRGSVELDVRNAYTDLETATDQVRVADSNRQLALQTLRRSQDRFQAGVATSVEVVQSQESLAAANRDYVSSLYAFNVAKISLARAVGNAETNIPQFLKGN
jgi:outer membrane protein TolC